MLKKINLKDEDTQSLKDKDVFDNKNEDVKNVDFPSGTDDNTLSSTGDDNDSLTSTPSGSSRNYRLPVHSSFGSYRRNSG